MTEPSASTERQLSRTTDRAAQWILAVFAAAFVLCLLRVVLSLLSGHLSEALPFGLLALVFGLQTFVWRLAVAAPLVVSERGISRPVWRRAPAAGSGWILTWDQVAGAVVTDGRFGPVLVVRTQPPAVIHASRWLQGIDRELARGAVVCPVDEASIPQIEAELAARRVPQLHERPDA